MRKLLSLILAIAMLLSLAACSSQSETTPATTEGTQQAQASTTATTEPASDYPNGTIQWILAGTAGSGPDTFYRALIPEIEERLNATIVPENVLWNAAVQKMLENKADGYSISNMPTPNAYKRNLDPSNDNDPSWQSVAVVCSTYVTWETFAVRADDERFTDVNSLADFIDWCKANPNETLLVGVKSAISTDDLTLYLIQGETGIGDQLVHVTSTNASERNTSFLNKGVDVMIATTAEVQSLVKDGSAKIISVFTDERLEIFPDAPTAKEVGIDVKSGSYNFIVMHPDTPQSIRDTIDSTVKDILTNDKEAIALLESMGYEIYYRDSATFASELAAEEEALSKVKSMWGW